MSLKTQLYLVTALLHIFLFSVALFFFEELGSYIVLVEAILVLSAFCFIALIKKAMQPLNYVETFSKLIKEEEFTARFSEQKQSDLDQLIQQFNVMLEKLHHERLAIGEQKGIFQKLMAESPIGVVLLDYEGHITDINPACEKLLAISKEQVFGKNLPQLANSQIKYLRDIEVDSHQLIEAEQGRQLKVAHYVIRDRGFNRSFYMLYELTNDIVQSQKLAYEKLIRLMSHEVNNTIAITNSLLESCLHYKTQLDADSGGDFDDAINIVIKRSESLNKFMQAYASVVKLEKPIKTSFNLSKMLQDLGTLFFAQCDKLNIKISVNAKDDINIVADANLLEQALVNLIQNAVEAIGENGEIIIDLTQSQSEKVLKISDTGCGINSDIERQLFTPFFTSKEFGQGVGLMLVREILRLHDIEHSLNNREDKKGAVFTWVIEDR